MTTDVKVQFFSHLNGLNLGNNWGDLIRLLDATLVNGVSLPSITAASIDEQGDVHLSFYTDHKALLFQVVELAGFAPELLNQKYRIKGVPSATSLILKPKIALSETVISSSGTAKLAPLGYEIIFRDVNDVKRVYRAKNPTAQHPFIRVDETISGLNGNYSDTYAKYAMVGLLEHMTHIDDYANPDVLQLPFDPSDPAKNWKITGTGTAVVRGWSRWHYSKVGTGYTNGADSNLPTNTNKAFTLVGDLDAFYLLNQVGTNADFKILRGCGLFNSALESSVIPNWFLFSFFTSMNASVSWGFSSESMSSPLQAHQLAAASLTLKYAPLEKLSQSITANPILVDYLSGRSNLYSGSTIPALEVPFVDTDKILRGTYKHVMYAGKTITGNTKPIIANSSMYVSDTALSTSGNKGGFYFYLGELE